jgi:hypothetical protein
MIIIGCICIAILSILFLLGWFFNLIEIAQGKIDDNENQ